MFPAPNRLRRPAEFAQAVRRGRRAARGSLVVHLAEGERPDAPPRVGLTIGRVIGSAVTRNRVRRRLRALLRARLAQLPTGSVLVVRAVPAAATATYARLGSDLDSALRRVTPRVPAGNPPGGSEPR